MNKGQHNGEAVLHDIVIAFEELAQLIDGAIIAGGFENGDSAGLDSLRRAKSAAEQAASSVKSRLETQGQP